MCAGLENYLQKLCKQKTSYKRNLLFTYTAKNDRFQILLTIPLASFGVTNRNF